MPQTLPGNLGLGFHLGAGVRLSRRIKINNIFIYFFFYFALFFLLFIMAPSLPTRRDQELAILLLLLLRSSIGPIRPCFLTIFDTINIERAISFPSFFFFSFFLLSSFIFKIFFLLSSFFFLLSSFFFPALSQLKCRPPGK